eukprot:CAMPEP_0201475274 /NCGR_PEP_ID=MMETSP0151_2-20130828/730_1 /ASSEMBLY_ACC=CAM_ASM_000257 /TAXON_ID=200890 /ORGANISM="Paramoeba atlantica, Strain 621/1 / CCAP 1560/9" /LENGTH=93 /DNA_ID=CAMNT_0047855319 /DNA_START=667 /DNA_END=949 /DNA_ORIENTATION=-
MVHILRFLVPMSRNDSDCRSQKKNENGKEEDPFEIFGGIIVFFPFIKPKNVPQQNTKKENHGDVGEESVLRESINKKQNDRYENVHNSQSAND